MAGGKNLLYRNNGDGTFTDVSEQSGILETTGTYGLGVLVSDFDNDGWPDIYVADDSVSSILYHNQKSGKFVDIAVEAGCGLSADGKPQAGMGISAGDIDHDGDFELIKTNFAGDTPTLYKAHEKLVFEDVTFAAGLGLYTKYLGWGNGFFDFDNDGWTDILICNGHVYPEVEQLKMEAGYAQRKILYRNLRNGKFQEVVGAGPGIDDPTPSRGCAFGDFDNDGDVDFVINNVNTLPQLVRCDSRTNNNWIKIKCIGTKSNRSAIGARVYCAYRDSDGKSQRQMDEVRSGSGYISQSDLRIHFGLGKAEKVELIEIRWPTGETETFKDLTPNRLYILKEGAGIEKVVDFKTLKK
jgi:hypothetical protein